MQRQRPGGTVHRFTGSMRDLGPASKQSIMWLLLVMLALFFAGMSILSHLNLDFSQRAMTALRQTQIIETFSSNLNRIQAQQHLLEQATRDLARNGEWFQRLPQVKTNDVEQALAQKLRDYPAVFGMGLWYEPGNFPAINGWYSPHAYRQGDGGIQVRGLRHASQADYRQQAWPLARLPQQITDPRSPPRLYWSPAYYDPRSDAVLLSLISPMYDPAGRLIGVASTDWRAEVAIDLISQIELTPNTFAFLLDRNNRNLSSLSKLEDSLGVQRLIDAVVKENLVRTLPQDPVADRLNRAADSLWQSRTLETSEGEYALFFAPIIGEMLFGIGVPQAEIDAVLAPMRSSNHRILLATGAVMLLLSVWMLYRIASLLRDLQASYTDELTRLPNRARLMNDMGLRQGSLVLINLDRFEEINSLFGYSFGDDVLRVLATRLEAFMAQHPLAGSHRLYRLTADEFALLFPVLSKPDLEQLLQDLDGFLQHQQFLWKDQEIALGATLGAATGRASDAQGNLLSWATMALKQARGRGASHQVYDDQPQVTAAYERNLVMATQLKDALREGRITPWFQPILSNRDGRIEKQECLVRMLDRNGTPILPGEFLEVARRLRLDRQLTRCMIQRCFAVFQQRREDFSINLSYGDLKDPELGDFITQHLASSGIGQRVMFEILESDGIENYDDVRRFVRAVKAFGCKIAIDDFGTGYSNFEHLLRLNIDVIKIDGSLIRHLPDDPNAYRVTQGIVSFAHSLNITTVAEFVHSETVQNKVCELGIDYSQGAYIGMPTAQPVMATAIEAH